jgi:hypothetical protein
MDMMACSISFEEHNTCGLRRSSMDLMICGMMPATLSVSLYSLSVFYGETRLSSDRLLSFTFTACWLRR